MISKAREFAIKKHGDQKYGDKPYLYHLESVVSLLEPYGETAQIIGYLHDVVEDTVVTLEEVESQFNSHISKTVAILTDQPGENRKDRKLKTYKLMSEVAGDLEVALLVKTADRLANVQACLDLDRKDKLNMYRTEHEIFKKSVYRPGLCDDLWMRLDNLLG